MKQPTISPVLKTKLRPPAASATGIHREHLIEHCNSALDCRALLVSAPPGYGKTTLLTQWIRQDAFPATAWLSLDTLDNNPLRFLNYLLHAFDTVVKDAMQPLLELLTMAQPPSPVEIVAGILSVLEERETPLVLVLDDYHVIEEQSIHEALLFLLTHTPDTLHMCIATRSDPPMPLGRLRSMGQLVEVRVGQLTFNELETDAFCRINEITFEKTSLNRTLHAHTEGWVTALQLASLSLNRHPDPEKFIHDFSGSNRTVADYFAEEVFHHLPGETLDFLLETSPLETMCATLCRELTGNDRAGELLLQLEKSNLFVTALDDERKWFRYHQLFRQLLLEKLHTEHPDLVQTLNLLACEWYKRNNRFDEALEHAFRLDDPVHAIALVDRMTILSSNIGFSRKVNRWVNTLPERELSLHPQLGIYRAGLALKLSDLPAATATFALVKEALRRNESSLPVSQLQQLSGRLALLEASAALLRGDIPASIDFCNTALSLPEENGCVIRCNAASLLGVLHMWNGEGDMQAAVSAFDTAGTLARRAGSSYLYATATFQKAIVLHYTGDLPTAKTLLDSLIKELTPLQSAYPGICGSVTAERADLLQEQGDSAEALSLATKGLELAESSCEPLSIWWAGWRMACIHYYNDDPDSALQQLGQLDTLSGGTAVPFWFTCQSAALRGHILIDREQLQAGRLLLEQYGITRDTPASHAYEALQFAYCRQLLAEQEYEACSRMLTPLAAMTLRTGRLGAYLSTGLLQAELAADQGNVEQATELLLHIVSKAAGGRFTRIIAKQRQLIDRLHIAQHVASDREISAFLQQPAFAQVRVSSSGNYRDDLSERETELLCMLAHGYSNLEIAEKMFISVNTVKTHLKRINGKLGTENRTQAVAEARILGLLR